MNFFENLFSNKSADEKWQWYHENGILPNLWKGATGQLSMEMQNQQNLQFQQDNLDYQKQLQQQIFDREDTAYQRMLADTRAAGLAPAAQGNAAGEAIPTEAKHSDVDYQAMNRFNLAKDVISSVLDIRHNISDLAKQDSETAVNNATAIQIGNSNSLFDYDTLKSLGDYQLQSARWNVENSKMDYKDKVRNLSMNELFGWTSNTPDWLKIGSLAANKRIMNYKSDGSFYGNDVLSGNGNQGIFKDYSSLTSGLTDNITGLLGGLMKSLPKAMFNMVDDMLPQEDKSGNKVTNGLKNYLGTVLKFFKLTH